MRTLCDMMYKYKYTNDTRMPICADSRLLRKVVAEEVLVFAEWKCGNKYQTARWILTPHNQY